MSKVDKINKSVRHELSILFMTNVLNKDQYRSLCERYPTNKWNLASLVRWFSVLGAVSLGAGILLLLMDNANVYVAVELFCSLVIGLCFYGKKFVKSLNGKIAVNKSIELIGCFAISGLTFALGLHFSTGSGNWPALVGIDTVITLFLAYVLMNRLILIYALCNLYLWFGGSAGYISGWGAYWLSMSYPVRYLAVGILSLALAWGHGRWEHQWLKQVAGFSRVWWHFGLLIVNLSLWFMSIFGVYGEEILGWGSLAARVTLVLVWFGACAAQVSAGIRWPQYGVARSYGLVFCIINAYTSYFQFVAANSPGLFFIHFVVIGFSLLAVAKYYERRKS